MSSTEIQSDGRSGPRVSVIMPVYNAESYLPEAIESILAQNYADWELILVDDASTDGSGQIAREYADSHDKIHYYRNDINLGVAKTRNRALGYARGEYVAPLDDDDVAAPERLSAQVEFLDANPDYALVASNLDIINENSRLVGTRSYPESNRAIQNCITRVNPIANPASMFRRAVFNELGGRYNESVCPVEDYDFVARVAAGYKVANLQQRLTRYRISTTQAKVKYLKKTLQLTLQIQQKAITNGALDPLYNKGYRMALRCLLLFPDRFVLELFKRLTYRKSC